MVIVQNNYGKSVDDLLMDHYGGTYTCPLTILRSCSTAIVAIILNSLLKKSSYQKNYPLRNENCGILRIERRKIGNSRGMDSDEWKIIRALDLL